MGGGLPGVSYMPDITMLRNVAQYCEEMGIRCGGILGNMCGFIGELMV